MPCSDAAGAEGYGAQRAVAERLLSKPVLEAVPLFGGGNNRVFRVVTAEGPFLLKYYPATPGDPRDRLGTEVGALEFLAEAGIRTVPRVIRSDRSEGCAVLEWIEGRPVGRRSGGDIDAALAFVRELLHAGGEANAAGLALASEACLSTAELARQIDRRLERLQPVLAEEPALANFLDGQLRGVLASWLARARARLAGAYDREVPRSGQVLSPSDFGFHNALRRPDGRLTFLDFEYFGWDDPVKLVADFLLHPGMALEDGERREFRRGAEGLFGQHAGFGERLDAQYPLYVVRWCLIILNEFLPDRWRLRAGARQIAADERESHREAKARQLAKATRLLYKEADSIED